MALFCEIRPIKRLDKKKLLHKTQSVFIIPSEFKILLFSEYYFNKFELCVILIQHLIFLYMHTIKITKSSS